MAAILKPKPADPPIALIGMNSKDAARSIGISTKKLYELVDGGEIPCVRLSRQTYIFDPKDLADWISKNKCFVGK